MCHQSRAIFPDKTRSGYFATAERNGGGAGENDDLSVVSDATSDTSESGSECDEDVVHEDEEAALEKVAGSWAPDVEANRSIPVLSHHERDHFGE